MYAIYLEFLILKYIIKKELVLSFVFFKLLFMSLEAMELTRKNSYVGLIKSFLVWSFTLTVCLLVVGFPVGALMVTVGLLATIVLQTVLPASAVLLVTGSIFSLNIAIVLIGAAVLSLRGIYPEEVSWLNWLHEQKDLINTPVYASCPLTCQLELH